MNKITEVKIERGIPTLYVDGQPFWAFAGEVHNSAAYAPGQDGGRDMDEDGSESSEYTDCTGSGAVAFFYAFSQHAVEQV